MMIVAVASLAVIWQARSPSSGSLTSDLPSIELPVERTSPTPPRRIISNANAKRSKQKLPGNVSVPAAPSATKAPQPDSQTAPAESLNPYARVESLLRQVQGFMGANSPGRAYRVANDALDLIAQLQPRPDLDAVRLESLKTRAERATTAAMKQCDNTADPNTIRTQCP